MPLAKRKWPCPLKDEIPGMWFNTCFFYLTAHRQVLVTVWFWKPIHVLPWTRWVNVPAGWHGTHPEAYLHAQPYALHSGTCIHPLFLSSDAGTLNQITSDINSLQTLKCKLRNASVLFLPIKWQIFEHSLAVHCISGICTLQFLLIMLKTPGHYW